MTYSVSRHTGLRSDFEYKYVQGQIHETDLAKYCPRLRSAYARRYTKTWSNEKHTEWLMRHYLAVKMVLSATVMLTSYEYATRKNLRIVEPYLLYYACICSCRALILTLPDKDWDPRNLYAMSHQQIINVSVDALTKISRPLGEGAHRLLKTAKAQRELFSYKFPALGIQSLTQPLSGFDEVVRFCAVVCEVAQMHSECLEASINKHVAGNYSLSGDAIRACFAYNLLGDEIIDEDDYYRIGYYERKNKKPSNLKATATEGMVEDYFGAWRAESPGNDLYDPESNIQVIFPFV